MKEYKKLKASWTPNLDQDMMAITTWEKLEVSLEDKINACRISVMIYESDDSTPAVLFFYQRKLSLLLQEKLMKDYCE